MGADMSFGVRLIVFILIPAVLFCGSLLFSVPCGAVPALAGDQLFDELGPRELKSKRYFYMVDEEGRTILTTGHRLRVKDRYLTADNDLYEVESIEGYLARARFVEKVRLVEPPEISNAFLPLVPVQNRNEPAYKIAIYHTHNAECYVPSDGTDTVYGAGGIHEVGLSFKEALEKKGITVLYSDQLHLPHDRGAYRRSRVTALRLLRQHPDAIFDVHRDAAPWEAYALELKGEPVTQIQIVVGLSNPGTSANQQFAYDLKGYADRLYPGLIHGVMTIWGSYNQDLSPLALLLEVGAHTNTKESAERGIARFADVVSYYFYGPAFIGDARVAPPPSASGGAPAARPKYGIMHAVSGTVLSLLLAALGAAVGFYFLNNPDALKEFFLWWSELPARAAGAVRQGLASIQKLPLFLGTIRREAPENLRRAWFILGLERRIIPRLLKALGAAALFFVRSLREAATVIWREAPRNLRRGRQLLSTESHVLPRMLSESIHVLGMGAAGLWGRASAVIRKWGERLNSAWAEAKVEAGELLSLFREAFLLLRSRLRP